MRRLLRRSLLRDRYAHLACQKLPLVASDLLRVRLALAHFQRPTTISVAHRTSPTCPFGRCRPRRPLTSRLEGTARCKIRSRGAGTICAERPADQGPFFSGLSSAPRTARNDPSPRSARPASGSSFATSPRRLSRRRAFETLLASANLETIPAVRRLDEEQVGPNDSQYALDRRRDVLVQAVRKLDDDHRPFSGSPHQTPGDRA